MQFQIIKKVEGKLTDSYLDEGFILNKTIAVNSPKRMENVKFLIANTYRYVDGDLISANLDSSNGHRQNQDLWRSREGGQHGEVSGVGRG
jgi:hypothetical protein